MAALPAFPGRRWPIPTTLAFLAFILAGCQADYGVDITNRTPQAVFARIFRKGSSQAVLGAAQRLGPGDRSFVGPVRTDKQHGAFLSIDTYSNPGQPITADLL